MKDIDIYNLAGEVLRTITHDLNESTYAKLGGELSLIWSEDKIFGAFASSEGKDSEPPKHSVTVHYAFIRQMWKDAESFCQFLKSIPDGSGVDKLYHFYGDRTKLPHFFDDEGNVKNIFIGALTWVYFHELGHLMQEHGIVRNEYGTTKETGGGGTTNVYDFQISSENPITGDDALISHVTELAADFEATYWYVAELIRHVTDPKFFKDKNSNDALSALLYLMVCGISLVFFRFNGNRPMFPTALIDGSHPQPTTRLEFIIPQIFENLDGIEARKATGHEFDRKYLVELCNKAVLSAALYWSMTKTAEMRFDERFMIKGLVTNAVVLEYLQPIVKCWDEILPRVQDLRRYGHPLGLMNFTDGFRSRIFGVVPWGSGPEKSN